MNCNTSYLHARRFVAVVLFLSAAGSRAAEPGKTPPVTGGMTNLAAKAAGVNGNIKTNSPDYALDGAGGVNVTGGVFVNEVAVNATPAGVVMPYAGSNSPSGYLLCDGAAVSRTTYAALFAVISTNYGAGDGTTTFNVPNLKGRVPAGLDSAQAEFAVLAATGGEKTHVLTPEEMPAHTHAVDPAPVNTSEDGNHRHSRTVDSGSGIGSSSSSDYVWKNPDANSSTSYYTDPAGNHIHTVDIPATTSGSTGGSGTHNNLAPYLVLNYIIKY